MHCFRTNNQKLVSSPITREWIIEGEAEARSTVLSTSGDGLAFVVIWECSPGKFRWNYAFDETIHFLEGSVTFENDSGNTTTAGAGDVVYFTQGSSIVWNVHERVRKVAFCRKAFPTQVGTAIKVLRRLKATFSRAKSSPVFASPVQS